MILRMLLQLHWDVCIALIVCLTVQTEIGKTLVEIVYLDVIMHSFVDQDDSKHWSNA